MEGILKLVLRVDKNIVKVYSIEVVEVVEEDVVYITLVGSRAISKAKR